MSTLHLTSRPTGVDIARDAIRAAIVRGEFPIGGRLTLAGIATRLGTSVTPIREALRDLAGEGLVDLDAHKGARVHAPTPAEMRETYALRTILEPKAMAELAALPREQTAVACIRARTFAARMAETSDPPEWAALNREFHAEVARPLEGAWPRLCAMVTTLRNVSLLPVASALERDHRLMRRADLEHVELLEAIEHRDPERAADMTAAHLDSTRRVLLGESD